jgi:predicted metal-dependent phosphoesterase TrpH
VLKLMEKVHRKNGVMIPAHPFRTSAPSLGSKVFDVQGFDGLEVLNGNASEEQNQMAKEAALKLNLPGMGGSDAHSHMSVGRCVTVFEDDGIHDEWNLISAIKNGRCQPKQIFR